MGHIFSLLLTFDTALTTLALSFIEREEHE